MSRLQIAMLSVFAGILVVLMCITVKLANDQKASTDIGFVRPEFDTMAVVGEPTDVPEELDFRAAQLKEGYAVGLCGNLQASEDGAVDIYFTSFEGNKYWVRIALYTEDGKKLGSSGMLKPGEYVQSVKLDNMPTKNTVVVAKILSYEPDTYYSMGSANVKINMNVRK